MKESLRGYINDTDCIGSVYYYKKNMHFGSLLLVPFENKQLPEQLSYFIIEHGDVLDKTVSYVDNVEVLNLMYKFWVYACNDTSTKDCFTFLYHTK